MELKPIIAIQDMVHTKPILKKTLCHKWLASIIDKNAGRFLFSLGVSVITYSLFLRLYKTYQNWKWIPRHLLNRQKVTEWNLKSKYGDCYVVVTGCTEGIGLSYAT